MEAFFCCSSLKRLTLEEGVGSIGGFAFAGCDNLPSAEIPASVTSIGECAFSALSLRRVTIRGALADYSTDIYGTGYGWFDPSDFFTLVTDDWTGPADTWLGFPIRNVRDDDYADTELDSVLIVPASAEIQPSIASDGCLVCFCSAFMRSGTIKIVRPEWSIESGESYADISPYDVDDRQIVLTAKNTTGSRQGVTILAKYSENGVTQTAKLTVVIAPLAPQWAKPTYETGQDPSGIHDADGVQQTADGGSGTMENSAEVPSTVVVNAPVYAGMIVSNYAKTQVVNGSLYRGGVLAGTVQVKVGKADKKGNVKISGTATLLEDGKTKKITAKGVKIALDEQNLVPTVSLPFKAPIGEMSLEMADNGKFTLKNAAYEMAKASVGGDWGKTGARVYVDAGRVTALPAGTIEELLPDGEPVIPKRGKWSFAKAASVKYVKDKATNEFSLVIDDTRGTNRSSMRLTYTPKTGVFKGSFKVYAIQDGKLKKFTVKVIGVVVDGKGQGSAAGAEGLSFAVTVE